MLQKTFQNTLIQDQDTYTQQDFLFRLKCLRNICIHKGLDAILVINGVHGGDNPESSKLTNWLFQGASGHKLFYNTVEDEIFDETI